MPLPIVWHPAYEVHIGPHVFPTRKYRLVRDQLLAHGVIANADLVQPAPASDDQVALVHTSGYVRKIKTATLSAADERLLEVPFSPALRESAWLCAGGSTIAGRLALERETRGIAVHLGGGFHHAFPDHGEGFCLINDVAIAIRVLQREGAVRRPAVVDLDVHHGNGTAAIFRGDPDVFTFSMHQEHNYPAVKPPSDLDLGLEDGAGDAEYLALLERHLPELLARHPSRSRVLSRGGGSVPLRPAGRAGADPRGAAPAGRAGLRERAAGGSRRRRLSCRWLRAAHRRHRGDPLQHGAGGTGGAGEARLVRSHPLLRSYCVMLLFQVSR